jgi:SAM-dependent methyltransferase
MAHELPMEALSAPAASRFRASLRLIRTYAVGRVLDVGCGTMPFRGAALSRAQAYDGLDIEARTTGVRYLNDVQDMRDVPSESYETILCFEVLEHVPDPERALREMRRVLQPGGHILLTVPHLSRLHEEPHDYFRYTKYGLQALATRAHLDVVELQSEAGLFSFLSHQLSLLTLGLAWNVPVLRAVAKSFNGLVLVRAPLCLDRLTDRHGLFAAGYSAAFRKHA